MDPLLNAVGREIRNFLMNNGFETGVLGWPNFTHQKGIDNNVMVLVKPNFLLREGSARTIGITPTHVIDYLIRKPFAKQAFEEERKDTYSSPGELKKILLYLLKAELGCWEKK